MGELTDLLFTLLGKTGRWFNVQQKRICFLIWIACLTYWTMRNVTLGLKVQAGGCIFSMLMHIYGFINWGKKEKTHGNKQKYHTIDKIKPNNL